jgi:uncharacterized membrane protein
VGNPRLAVGIVGLALGLVSIVLQGKRLAEKSGGRRVLRIVIVSLVASAAAVVWMVNNRLHRRAMRKPPFAVSAIPSPSASP